MKSLYIYMIILLVTVAGIYYLAGDFFGGEPVRVKSGHLIDIEPREVSRGIYLRGDSIRIEFERSGSGWVVTEPVRTSGAINILDDMIENISSSIITEVIENPADLSEFGLDNPFCLIILYSEKRSSPDTIRVGSRAPTSSLRYSSVGSSREVYLSNEIISTTAEKTLFHFRNKKFININPDFMERLEFISDSRQFALERTDMGWNLEGTGITAREKYINGYIGTLDRMLVYRFIPASEENYQRYGLVSPRYFINLDSYQNNINFIFGKRMADMIYASRGDLEQIFLVRTDFLSIFSERYEFIFDLAAARFDSDELRVLAVSSQSIDLRLAYRGGNWSMAGGGAASDSLAAGLLESISSLEFTGLPSPAGTAPGRNADLAITMKDEKGELIEKVLLFTVGPGRVECWSSGSRSAGAVPESQFRDILTAAGRF
ncbi:MAG: DUF4340 domain-containing protein [Candidatus Latescibacteria bacterium]|nr:DUF4340 domain-containing protein [bacterium]MBD3424072.1 DUF4340 domain-containing protein [Candidatus Latescibacterota bacterium]